MKAAFRQYIRRGAKAASPGFRAYLRHRGRRIRQAVLRRSKTWIGIVYSEAHSRKAWESRGLTSYCAHSMGYLMRDTRA